MKTRKVISWLKKIKIDKFTILCSISIIIIQWRANSENDLKGYKLYFGNRSRFYSAVINVGIDTTYQIEDFTNGNYFFALTAYDSAGNESIYSNEINVYIENNKTINPSTASILSKTYNFPNPFNPYNNVTHIRYFLEEPEIINIDMLDTFGNKILTIIEKKKKYAGEHTEDIWDGKNDAGEFVQNGIYYCKVQTESKRDIFPIVVIK